MIRIIEINLGVRLRYIISRAIKQLSSMIIDILLLTFETL